MNSKRHFLASGLSLALAGCAGSAAGMTPGITGANGGVAPAMHAAEDVITAGQATAEAQPQAAKQGTLYALNVGGSQGTVTVYSGGSSSPLRTVKLAAADTAIPNAFYVSSSSTGVLYAAYPTEDKAKPTGKLSSYTNKGAKPVASVKLPKNYYGLMTDQSGNAYVVCTNHTICEYTQAGKIERKIPLGKAGFRGKVLGMAADPSGDVAIINSGEAFVFPPTGTMPTWIINNNSNIYNATAVTFDPSGNLYVANSGKIVGFAPNQSSPFVTISNGIMNPIQMLTDSEGDLYVLTLGRSSDAPSISEFATGQSSPKRTIDAGLSNPVTMALDPSETLYVANAASSSGDITVYPKGADSPSKTITNGINDPIGITVSP